MERIIMNNEILEKLKVVVSNIKGVSLEDLEFVDETTRITEDLGLNSIGVLYTVFAIERAFNITFEDLDFDSFQTVGDVIKYIEKNI